MALLLLFVFVYGPLIFSFTAGQSSQIHFFVNFAKSCPLSVDLLAQWRSHLLGVSHVHGKSVSLFSNDKNVAVYMVIRPWVLTSHCFC